MAHWRNRTKLALKDTPKVWVTHPQLLFLARVQQKEVVVRGKFDDTRSSSKLLEHKFLRVVDKAGKKIYAVTKRGETALASWRRQREKRLNEKKHLGVPFKEPAGIPMVLNDDHAGEAAPSVAIAEAPRSLPLLGGITVAMPQPAPLTDASSAS